MIAVDYSSSRGKGDNVESHENALPQIPRMKSILIVDDIVDSGYTMQEVAETYQSAGHFVRTFALYWKESAVTIPSAFWQKIPADSPWIVFPWEEKGITLLAR